MIMQRPPNAHLWRIYGMTALWTLALLVAVSWGYVVTYSVFALFVFIYVILPIRRRQ